MVSRILIVDDNVDDREVIQRALAGAPEILSPLAEAADEASCLAELDRQPDIDCVLLDFSLPGRDGLKVLARLLERDAFLAVVMLTGVGNQHVAVKAMKQGAQDYMSKADITQRSLLRATTNAIDRAALRRKIADQHESLQSFSRVLVHDLRAPLRSVRQAVEMLTEDLPAQVAAANGEMLSFITQGAERMDRLVLALKAYTEIGTARPEPERIDLAALVSDVRANLAADLGQANATIVCAGDMPVVHGRPAEIAQLIQNIVANGIKYNRSAAPEVRLSARDDETGWAIEIADNGIGIEPGSLTRIFEPFNRLHAESEFEGTGLGLATCKRIAERHGGSLSCRSAVGRGSVFELLLPRREIESAAADAPPSGPT